MHEIVKRFNMVNSKATPTPVITRLKLSKEDKGSKVDPTLFKRLVVIQMDLSGHPPFSLNHHLELLVLINHVIHPFDGEWNVMSSSFVNYIHHVMIS